jgi:hypothetical protein
MRKYEPLGQFLRKQKRSRIQMTFAEIETIIGTKLPRSKSSRAFWSNNPDNNVMTKEWIGAGFEAKSVDTRAELLIFSRLAKKSDTEVQELGLQRWNNIYGCMKGMVTIAPGVDITKPAIDIDDWSDGSIGGYHDL